MDEEVKEDEQGKTEDGKIIDKGIDKRELNKGSGGKWVRIQK